MKAANLFIAVLLAAGVQIAYSAEKPAKPPARVTVDLVAEKMVSDSATMLGVIDYDRIASVASEVGGIINGRSIKEGSRVQQGDLLASINTDFVRQDIKISQSDAAQAEIELTRLKKNLGRLESLIQTNAASRRSYEDALYTYQAQVKKRETLEKRIERLNLVLNKSRVVAPFDGVVIEKHKESGEWTGVGKTVAKIASTEDVIIRIAVSENLLPFIDKGKTVHAEIAALGKSLRGNILDVQPVADLRSKSIYVKIRIPYLPKMIQNMSASVEIPVSKKRMLRLFKRSAIVQHKGRNFVYMVIDDRAKMLPVNIVTRMGELVGVDNPNIKAGMSVVVDGSQRLKPNQPVKVVSKSG